MIEPSDEQVEAFRAAWIAADLEGAAGDRVRQGLRAALNLTPVHGVEPSAGGVTACCGRSIFELPRDHRMARAGEPTVTCPGLSA